MALDDDLPPLAVDPAAIAEVLYILLDNASKYSPAGHDDSRSRRRREDDASRPDVVADEGPGIPPELREQVFQKFFRIPGREAARSAPRRASASGLPIARRLVESQAGRIWIETPPSGTRNERWC